MNTVNQIRLNNKLIFLLYSFCYFKFNTFFLSDFPVKNYHIFDLWLNTALALLDVADDDTKKQLKHIAIIEIKFKHSFDPK